MQIFQNIPNISTEPFLVSLIFHCRRSFVIGVFNIFLTGVAPKLIINSTSHVSHFIFF